MQSLEQLDNFVLNIEFLLISVIQGLALGALATASLTPLTTFQWQTFPYIIGGLLLILIFWSGAINHALSFIDWPLDMTHNFLYFLLGFIEVLAFAQLANPLLWYIFMSGFFVVALLLYIFDLHLITSHQQEFSNSESRKKLYHHIVKEQKRELFYLLPAGGIFNLIAIWMVYQNPQIHLFFGVIQAFFLIGFLINFIVGYKKRALLITASIK